MSKIPMRPLFFLAPRHTRCQNRSKTESWKATKGEGLGFRVVGKASDSGGLVVQDATQAGDLVDVILTSSLPTPAWP